MKNMIRTLTTVGAVFAPLFAYAQTAESSPQSSALASFLWSVLPIIVVAVFVWWFFKRAVRKSQGKTDDYIAKQAQHMQRVEQLLERIAVAVERKDNQDV
jgi:membrane protein implicated in regulation of membrane protease activity